MVVRDPYSGLLHEVPDRVGYRFAESPFEEAPDLSEYDIGEVVYDGLGQPLGLFPLIPLIASALPAIAGAAKGLIPAVASAIPKVSSLVSSLFPSGGPALAPPAPMPAGEPMPLAPPMRYAPMAPGAPPADYGPPPGPPIVAPSGPTQIVIVRRSRRRRPHVG